MKRTMAWVRLCFACWLLGCAFAARAAWPPPLPANAQLSVRNDSAHDRVGELVRGGVPLPRQPGFTTTSGFAVVDAGGAAVPATFQVLARWNAARSDTSAPIQWLLVRFLATVPAASTRSYTLRTDGSVANPAPPVALTVTPEGNGFRVDTGVARFVVGVDPARPFERIERPVGNVLANASAFSSTIGGNTASGFAQSRRVVIEHADALSATIVVEGVYGHAQVGSGGISGGRRIEFSAASGAASVREWIDWEGQRCAFELLDCGNGLNAVALQRWRVQLAPSLGAAPTLTLQAANGQAPASAAIAAGSSASLRQLRRSDRSAAQCYELGLPGQPLASGVRADAGLALLAGAGGGLGVALAGMPDYEPQALRVLADGALALDLADDAVWLAARQGSFARYRIGAYATGTAFASVAADLWPALNEPLLALPAAQWIAATRATDEFPVGALPPALASFDTALDDLLARTIALRRDRGLEGLMTFGLYPRNWGNPVLSDEIDCGGADPTPADDWDDPYWCATWTDYHNTTAMAVIAAWRNGDPRPLHALSRPAALRSLHTQMLRCAPSDANFYCGQLPSGYGGYRTDFNGSHAYIENLVLNYWLTGDYTIVERLQRGARTMRGYLCPTRGSTPPGAVCTPTTPITDDFAGVNDRVANQFYQIFRFVGLASDDASYLDDWRSNEARFLTQNFALVQQGGVALGFTEPSGGGSTTIITGPGSYYTTQLWMASIYDFNLLHRLQVDTLDAPLGVPAITPSAAQVGWARTLRATALVPPANGSAAGTWPNTLRFTFSGNRIGGNLTALEPGWAPGPMPQPCFDDCLYDAGKSTLSAPLARAADETGDPALRALALDFATNALQGIAATPQPMGKASGELFGRLTSAVARLGAPEAGPVVFADGFE
ncbi:MAG: hypothetical protein OMOMHJEC_00763 [Xanthomonadales bacterium]|nr:hypothetical protein [Xanthomonadales bacterium]